MDWYEITEKKKIMFKEKWVVCSKHYQASHVCLWLFGKDISNYKIYKNGMLIRDIPIEFDLYSLSGLNSMERYLESYGEFSSD